MTIDTTVERPPASRAPHPLLALLGLTVALGVTLVALLLVYIMPSLASGPSGLAVGVVGTTATTDEWVEALDELAPGGYATEQYASRDELIAAITSREIVGGFVLDGGSVQAHVASAGSTAISGALTAAAETLADGAGLALTVVDAVPLPASDPAGLGIGGLAFPLVFGGIVPAVAFRAVFARRLGWAIGGIVVFSAVGGLAVAAVLMHVFGSIESAFWPVAGAMALGIAGLAIPLAGLKEAFRAKGFTIGAMVMMFLGNPFAGIATSSAWLPDALGVFGQALPPGAAGTLVRAAAYFDGAGGGMALVTLPIWVVAGAALLAIGARRAARSDE